MYQVIAQEGEKIEISLYGELTADEFQQVIHQLESLCTMHPHIYVLFDAGGLEKYDFKVFLEEYDFYKEYKSHLKRVALVSDKNVQSFLLDLFNRFTDTEFRTFDDNQIEEARKWIFPSRLP
ncbi:STAS/SEC14 domain-containing protein [candidate division KSB1 bacterium]|nr:STAS/SEC14 domain-containing protein [candidate division KSB1 bacterium]NIR68483.1 STAS/SEC14 domain-containing protein [candidate division KSB1 bacterium]NIS22497.1 STAS/SEC14 domain-containing protein [candidate division KSB1 bacterium]NIT69341.1 STAS/SEC14 domain-containing protein [candidate division KSB1 bacterium]NIU23002.1 STAS/SEC14 domain-containing protein [candidate division KSB1 bacterium]